MCRLYGELTDFFMKLCNILFRTAFLGQRTPVNTQAAPFFVLRKEKKLLVSVPVSHGIREKREETFFMTLSSRVYS